MFYLFLLIFCAFFAYLSWRRPVWALAFICAFLPSYLIRFKIGPLPMTLLETMILILFIAWLAKLIRPTCPASSADRCGVGPIALFLAAAAVSALTAPDWRASFGILKAYFIEPLLFLIVFCSCVKNRDDLKLIFKALAFSAFYISLYGLAQYFFGIPIPLPWQNELRITSVFPYPNAVGLFLAPITFLTLGLWSNKTRVLSKLAILAIVALQIITIIFAKSDGALAAIVIGVFFLLVINAVANGKYRRLLIGITIALAAVVFILFLIPAFQKIALPKLLFQDWSGFVRKTIWLESYEMLKDHAFFGAGLSGYQQAILPYHTSRGWMEIYLYPHNIFLNFWSETGLLGLATFLWLIFEFFKMGFACLKKNKFLNIILMASMVALLTHGLVDVPYFKNDLALLFWIIIGTILVVKAKL